jgi:hypothetical protein
MHSQSVRLLLTAQILALLAGCLHYTVEEVDYDSAQTKAAILVGDPQVYSRASLINDRRDETAYLKQLLANSTVQPDGTSVVKFSPQIIRDLKTVEALSASLGLNFGRGNGSSATDLNDQIQVAKLRAQLATLNKQIEGIQNAKAPDVTVPAPALGTDLTATVSGSDTHYTTPDVSKLQAAITSIQTQLTTLVNAGSMAPTAPSNNYGPLLDPRDDLIDRQAYRRDLRAALAEAQLDDTHDRGGNALYRLQFQATVLPPNGHSRQWGTARLTIKPPKLTGLEIVADYYNWLSHISSVLSAPPPHNYNYDRYVDQIGQNGFFGVIDILSRVNSPESASFCLRHTTGSDALLKEVSGVENGEHAPVQGTDQNQYVLLGTYAVPLGIFGPKESIDDKCASYNDVQKVIDPKKKPVISERHYPTSDKNRVADDTVRLITSLITQYDRSAPVAGEFRSNFLSTAIGKSTQAYQKLGAGTGNLAIPLIFCNTITVPNVEGDSGNCNAVDNQATFTAAGGVIGDSLHDNAVKSYSVLPGELAQRLGVTTEASQSLQTALTVAAQVSAAANASLDIGYLSQSDARAEALARQPIVVGYAGTEPGTLPALVTGTKIDDRRVARGPGYFGWLFGPQFAVKDTKTLELAQTVRSYGVNADISVPGWWSYLDLEMSTAWIHNWSSAIVLDPSTAVTLSKRVRLPEVDAIYDAMTEFVTSADHGLQNSRIFASNVNPDVVPACASTVTFQISGTNMWRANSALLGGVPAKEIRVLPDMGGITAEFDFSQVMGNFAASGASVERIPLLISAEQGAADPLPIHVIGSKQLVNGALSCQSMLSAPTSIDLIEPMIVSAAPTSVCADAQSFDLIVQGMNLPDDLQVTGGLYQTNTLKTSKGDYFTQVLTLSRHLETLGSPTRTEGSQTQGHTAGSSGTRPPLASAITVMLSGNPAPGNPPPLPGQPTQDPGQKIQLTARTVPLIIHLPDYKTAFSTNLDIKDCKAASAPAKPGSPTNVNAVSAGAAFTVTFSAPKDDGNGLITKYTATISNDSGRSEKPVTGSTSDGLTTAISLSPCTAGDNYVVSVIATRNSLDSDPAKGTKSFTCNK